MEAYSQWQKLLLLLMLVSILGACQKEKTLSPHTYVNWVEQTENGLRIEKHIHPLKLSIQYKPLEYIIALEERKEKLNEDFVQQRKAELGSEMDYYNFKIGLATSNQSVLMESAREESEYYKMIDYLSYAAKKDFYILDGADTSKCLLYQFVRNYELAPYLEFSLGFERKNEGDKTFVFDDKVFRTGTVKARIEQQKINKLPKLKTQ